MSRSIPRARIINRRTSKKTSTDPAQSGANYARLNATRLTITGIHNQIVFRAQGVLAARWENDETILLVMREETEDEPIVVRAYRSRLRREWETEDAHATAHPSTGGRFIAIHFRVPNSAVAILPTAVVVQDPAAKANLGGPVATLEWSGEDQTLLVRSADQLLQWNPSFRQFKKLPVSAQNESEAE